MLCSSTGKVTMPPVFLILIRVFLKTIYKNYCSFLSINPKKLKGSNFLALMWWYACFTCKSGFNLSKAGNCPKHDK